MKTVLVTGACGYIGPHVVERLQCSYNVVALDAMRGRNCSWPQRVRGAGELQLVKAGINSDAALDVIRSVDCIVHLAGNSDLRQIQSSGGDKSLSDQIGFYRRCAATGSPSIVFASSCSVYGSRQYAAREDGPCAPDCIYGKHKYIQEAFLLEAVKRKRLKSVMSLRIFNAIGPWRHKCRRAVRLVDRLCFSSICQKPVAILGDGKSTRDYVDVREVALAVKRAVAWSLNAEYQYETINICSGRETSVNQIINTVEAVAVQAGHKPPVTTSSEPLEFEASRIFGDQSKAEYFLDWSSGIDVQASICDQFRAWDFTMRSGDCSGKSGI